MIYKKPPKELQYTESFDYEVFLKRLNQKETKRVAWFNNFSPKDEYIFLKDKEEEFKENEILNYSNSGVNELVLSLFEKRQSTLLNSFDGSWTKNELFQLLESAIGGGQRERHYRESSFYLRNYPSGGALYSIKSYIFVRKVDGLDSGIYYISPDIRSIVKIKDNILDFESLFPMTKYKLDNLSDSVEKISFGIFFILDVENSFKKYGELVERLATLEAGHLAQNLVLVTSFLNKKALPVCGLFPENIESEIGIRKENKYCIYGILFG